MHQLLALLSGVACAAMAPGVARAESPTTGIAMYALVVGSNAGGAGQAALRFAEDDARRVAATLVELGGYSADAIDIVVHPTPDALREHLGQLGARVAADRAAGRQARVVFYYSGHARSTALDLGPDELALGELRQRLFAIPATLTVVVLDACQSGAFSRVKGAQPAADFSFNLRQHLDASGIAVLASSSGTELSQESEQLRSSYFTHHLLVGLRGAGDADHDGQVSIDEAYRYAYHQTLLATSETAVGGQHVSLEVELKGHGDVPLSFPRAATASIELPGALEGQTFIEHRRSRTVIAETYKAKGAPVRIAVAPGDYRVLVRHGGRLTRCEVVAGSEGVTIELDRCISEAIVVATSKGELGPAASSIRVELTGLTGPELKDGYVNSLDDFGFKRAGTSVGLAIAAMQRLDRRFWVGGFASIAASPEWTTNQFQPQRLTWTTTAIGALGRAFQPFGDDGLAARSGVYAQVGGGLGIGVSHYTGSDDRRTDRRFFGWAMTMGGGLNFDGSSGLGFSLGYQFDYAPLVDSLVPGTHASGGHRLAVGISYAR